MVYRSMKPAPLRFAVRLLWMGRVRCLVVAGSEVMDCFAACCKGVVGLYCSCTYGVKVLRCGSF
jgi:hypothetical protein